MTDKEKEAIDYLKVRLYGNEGCKSIDVSQKDLRIFLKLIDRKEKEIESWKKYSNEQEESIVEKNNKIYDLEFKIQTQQEEIERLKQTELKAKGGTIKVTLEGLLEIETKMLELEAGIEKKDKIINNSINEIEKIRQYFSEDLQVEFIRILEILKDKKVIDW